MAYRYYYNPESRRRTYERRKARIEAARAIGTHSQEEWQVLHDLFGSCVACGVPYEFLYGNRATKDHIMPIVADGCDCIGNIQPVCRQCNSVPDATDYRNAARPGWCQEYIARMTGGRASDPAA